MRKFTWTGAAEYIENVDGTVSARGLTGRFGTEFESSDQFQLDVTHDYDRLTVPFTPAGSPVEIAPGGYTFDAVTAQFTFGAQRAISGSVGVQVGEYYGGTSSGAGRLRFLTPDVRQCPLPVQLGGSCAQHQPAVPLGIRGGE